MYNADILYCLASEQGDVVDKYTLNTLYEMTKH